MESKAEQLGLGFLSGDMVRVDIVYVCRWCNVDASNSMYRVPSEGRVRRARRQLAKLHT